MCPKVKAAFKLTRKLCWSKAVIYVYRKTLHIREIIYSRAKCKYFPDNKNTYKHLPTRLKQIIKNNLRNYFRAVGIGFQPECGNHCRHNGFAGAGRAYERGSFVAE